MKHGTNRMKQNTPLPLLLPVLLLALLALRLPESNAAVVYTDRAAFLAAAAAWGPQTLDFESETAGTLLPDPTTVAGITFSGHGSPALIIDDTYDATSGVNYLGVNSAGTFNQFSYADSFDLAFAPMNAIGLNIITAEIPGVTLFDDDIRLDIAGIGTARLDASDVAFLTPGGDRVFFIGVIDMDNSFTTARVEGSGAFGFYNIDDVTTAVIPEPGTGFAMAAFAPVLLTACWWGRSANRKPSTSAT
jgi:hypothetical protein